MKHATDVRCLSTISRRARRVTPRFEPDSPACLSRDEVSVTARSCKVSYIDLKVELGSKHAAGTSCKRRPDPGLAPALLRGLSLEPPLAQLPTTRLLPEILRSPLECHRLLLGWGGSCGIERLSPVHDRARAESVHRKEEEVALRGGGGTHLQYQPL